MSLSVLLIEEDDLVGRFLAELLSERGWRAEVCATADEALARLSAASFDILVADRQPGLDLLAPGQALCPELRVVILATTGTVATAAEAFRAGASDYLLRSADDVESFVERLGAAMDSPSPDPRNTTTSQLPPLPRDYREALAALRAWRRAAVEVG